MRPILFISSMSEEVQERHWYEVIKDYASCQKVVPIMLPDQAEIKATLVFPMGDNNPVRSLSYMQKFFKKLPMFIWASPKPMGSKAVAQFYKNTVEIGHAAQMEKLQRIVEELQEQEGIIIITEKEWIDEIFNKFRSKKLIEGIYLYIGQKDSPLLDLSSHKGVKLISDFMEIINEHNEVRENKKIENRKFPSFLSSTMRLEALEKREKLSLELYSGKIDREASLNLLIQLAERIYGEDDEHRDEIQKFKNNYPVEFSKVDDNGKKIVMDFYTQQSFWYKLVNTLLRVTCDPYALAYIRIFAQDIEQTIDYECRVIDPNYSTFYRRSSFSDKTIELLRKKMHCHYCHYCLSICGFMSTSTQQNIAFSFTGNTLMEIHVDMEHQEQSLARYADISKLSEFPIEQERIFLPDCTFEILNIVTISYEEKEEFRERFFIECRKKIELKSLQYKIVLKLKNQKLVEFCSALKEEQKFKDLSEDEKRQVNDRFIEKKRMEILKKFKEDHIFQQLIQKKKKTFNGNTELIPQSQDILMKQFQLFVLSQKTVILRTSQYVEYYSNTPYYIWLSEKPPEGHLVNQCYPFTSIFHLKQVQAIEQFLKAIYPKTANVILTLKFKDQLEPIFESIKNCINLSNVFLFCNQGKEKISDSYGCPNIVRIKDLKSQIIAETKRIRRKRKKFPFLILSQSYFESLMKKQDLNQFEPICFLKFIRKAFGWSRNFFQDIVLNGMNEKAVRKIIEKGEKPKYRFILEVLNEVIWKQTTDDYTYPSISILLNLTFKAIKQISEQEKMKEKENLDEKEYFFWIQEESQNLVSEFLNNAIGKSIKSKTFIEFEEKEKSQIQKSQKFNFLFLLKQGGHERGKYGFINKVVDGKKNNLIINPFNLFFIKKVGIQKNEHQNSYYYEIILILDSETQPPSSALVKDETNLKNQNKMNMKIGLGKDELVLRHDFDGNRLFKTEIGSSDSAFNHLQTLIIDRSYIRDRGLSYFRKFKVNALSYLSLMGNEIGDRGILFLSHMSFCRLSKLLLYKNQICDEGVINLYRFDTSIGHSQLLLNCNWGSIKQITLNNNRISPSGFFGLFLLNWGVAVLKIFSANPLQKKEHKYVHCLRYKELLRRKYPLLKNNEIQ